MPNYIRTAIIDSNTLVIEDIKLKLAQIPIVHLVGEANTYFSGIQLIQSKSPDLLFLDIEMPGKSGFELIKELKNKQSSIPFIVFINIHAEYTLKALRSGAIDYLLKPVSEDELQNAVNKAFNEIQKGSQQNKIDHLIEYVSKYKQLFFPSVTGYKSVNIREIIFIKKNTETTKVEVFFGESDFLVLPQNYSLAQLAEVLPKIDFFQVKRELIINLRYLSEIEIFNKECILKKGNYTAKIEISRRSLKEFKDRMVF